MSIAAHLTNIDTLQAKIAALESSLDHLSGLVKEGKIETSKEISEKLGGLQLDVGIVEKLRTEIDSISRMRSEDKEKALSLLDRLSAIEKEIQKLENILGSYPAEEAQRTDYLKQKLDEVENEVRGIRQGDIKNMIKGEMDNLRRRMNEFEDDYRRRGLDVNQQQTLELQLIIEMLERIEDRLGRLGSKDSSVYINVGELHRTTDDLTRELNKLKSRESSETSRAIGEIKRGSTRSFGKTCRSMVLR